MRQKGELSSLKLTNHNLNTFKKKEAKMTNRLPSTSSRFTIPDLPRTPVENYIEKKKTEYEKYLRKKRDDFERKEVRLYPGKVPHILKGVHNQFLLALAVDFYQKSTKVSLSEKIAASVFNALVSNKQEVVILNTECLTKCYLEDPNWDHSSEEDKAYEIDNRVNQNAKNRTVEVNKDEIEEILNVRFDLQVFRTLPTSNIKIYRFNPEATLLLQQIKTLNDFETELAKIYTDLATQSAKKVVSISEIEEPSVGETEALSHENFKLAYDYPAEISESALKHARERKKEVKPQLLEQRQGCQTPRWN